METSLGLYPKYQTWPRSVAAEDLSLFTPMAIALFYCPSMPTGSIHALPPKDLFSYMIRKTEKILTSITFKSKFFKV